MALLRCCQPKLFTLVLITENNRVLLGKKKRGFGEGYFNGFGGKARFELASGCKCAQPQELCKGCCPKEWKQVEAGEGVREAAARELLEEACITTDSLTHRGVLTFVFDDKPQPWEVHVFQASSYRGMPQETEEMALQWFEYDSIPYDKMWADDPLWYPVLLQTSASFLGTFHFVNTHTLVSHELKQVEGLKEPL